MYQGNMMMPPPPQGGSDMMIILVMVMMMCCVFSLLGGIVGYTFLLQGEEGDECEGDDENAKYELDDKLKCKFVKCKDGYTADSTGVCVVDQSGKNCTPEGTSIVDGTYRTDVSNVCTFVTCDYGYQLNEDSTACVVVPGGGGGGGGAGAGAGGGGGGADAGGGPDPNAIDADTRELADVANEDNYSLAQSEYYWYKYYNYHKIVWNGEVIAVFIEPNYDFGVGQNKIEDGGDIATIGYYEKDGYAYHRWPQYQTDGGYAQGITNNTYSEFKLIKTIADTSKTQPGVNYNVADYSRYAR